MNPLEDSPRLRQGAPQQVVGIDHRDLRDDEFWRGIKAYAQLSRDEFNDYRFQSRNCVTSLSKLQRVIGDKMDPAFYRDVEEGIERSTMSLPTRG